MLELIRTFIAVDIDSEQIESACREVQKRLMQTEADLKLVDAKNLHFTLRFIGEIPQDIVDRICKELARVSFESFSIRISGVGAFPSLSRINVVWFGLQKGQEEMTKISLQVEAILKELGVPSDPKSFSPHLTLARVRSSRNRDRLAQEIKSLQAYLGGEMTVRTVRLKQSDLTAKGPVYTTICEAAAK